MWFTNRKFHASRKSADTLNDSQPNHAARMHSGTRPSHARTGVLQRLEFLQEDALPHPFPQAVQRYLLPLQSMYAKWYEENVRHLTQNYSYCTLCKTKQSNLQRHHMQHHARWRSIWFCPIPGCPSSLSTKEGLVKHLQSRPHGRGIELNLGRRVAKQIANQNCYWPVTQVMADKLLSTSKMIIRYIALYSMAGVAMESRLFRIHPNARDTPFMDACAAFLSPKMDLSQVMPSGCHLRQVAQPPANQLAVPDRPSPSDFQEDEETINPEAKPVGLGWPRSMESPWTLPQS